MKPQDKKILIGGGIGIAALAYFMRRRTSGQGSHVEFQPRDHRKHGGDHGGDHEHKNDRGEYGKKKHHHHED